MFTIGLSGFCLKYFALINKIFNYCKLYNNNFKLFITKYFLCKPHLAIVYT